MKFSLGCYVDEIFHSSGYSEDGVKELPCPRLMDLDTFVEEAGNRGCSVYLPQRVFTIYGADQECECYYRLFSNMSFLNCCGLECRRYSKEDDGRCKVLSRHLEYLDQLVRCGVYSFWSRCYYEGFLGEVGFMLSQEILGVSVVKTSFFNDPVDFRNAVRQSDTRQWRCMTVRLNGVRLSMRFDSISLCLSLDHTLRGSVEGSYMDTHITLPDILNRRVLERKTELLCFCLFAVGNVLFHTCVESVTCQLILVGCEEV